MDQFDCQLQLFLHDHPVIHSEAVHQHVSRLIVELARAIQHVYPEAMECLKQVI